ncbi:MAG: hypothetical protein OXJ37_21475 [Bryobacterales bacterium]|nr:hypothetical protein [Bryobacterales bacterium]MDE0620058.1 hypothetical protein [Bryobacterales bacterium]
MNDGADLCRRLGVKRVLNAMGVPTILGANTVSENVRSAVDSIMQVSVEIDELQAAACRVISRHTGAEAGCVTSSCSAALVISAAAAMTGSDLSAIGRLPDTSGMPDQVVLPAAHDVNFGAPVSQMIRISGANVVRIGTGSHCDGYHLKGALDETVAAVFYVDSGDVNPAGSFLSLEECVEIAGSKNIPVVVDTAAGSDVRPFVKAGADLAITSAHKQMGAPTSGMICGKLDLVRACYLQNYGIGRAMKVGKEGIVGCMVATKTWYGRDPRSQDRRCRALAGILSQALKVRPGPDVCTAIVSIPMGTDLPARALANCLREGDPPVWVNRVDDANQELWLDLRVANEADATAIARRIAETIRNPGIPAEDVPYHDLYWSERRLLEWPAWR